MTEKVFIIYDNDRLEKNGFFADSLKMSLDKYGVKNQVIFDRDITDNLPDIAIIRIMNPLFTKKLEERGVICCNNYETSKIANDKYNTYLFAKENGFKCMPTRLAIEGRGQIDYPLVAKSRYGHGGSEVFLIKNEKDLDELFKKANIDDYILQECSKSVGRDLRVYVMGGKIYQAILRTGKNDFRSNFSLGGTPTLYNLNDDEKNFVNDIISKLNADFVGVDFIFDNGLALNEIEDVVGCRMLYKLTNKNAANDYIDYIYDKYLKK